jgi:hypothetical protein
MVEKINKRGQMVIWVIVALFLVISIAFFLFIDRRVSSPTEVIVREVNPERFIDDCVNAHVDSVVDIILPQGGFVNPVLSKEYKGDDISYLCYNRGNYRPCIQQHPLLLSDMEFEITSYLGLLVDTCFSDLAVELEKRSSEVTLGDMEVNVALGINRVYVDISRELIISKNGESTRFRDFDTEVISPVYNLGRIASEIAAQEARYCHFEYVGYMILYPEVEITKTPLSDSTIIYSITDKASESKMNIAIRGCAIPPGF